MRRRIASQQTLCHKRSGMTSVETVMSAGVLIPIGGALFFLAAEALPYLFAAIQDVVCLPYL